MHTNTSAQQCSTSRNTFQCTQGAKPSGSPQSFTGLTYSSAKHSCTKFPYMGCLSRHSDITSKTTNLKTPTTKFRRYSIPVTRYKDRIRNIKERFTHYSHNFFAHFAAADTGSPSMAGNNVFKSNRKILKISCPFLPLRNGRQTWS